MGTGMDQDSCFLGVFLVVEFSGVCSITARLYEIPPSPLLFEALGMEQRELDGPSQVDDRLHEWHGMGCGRLEEEGNKWTCEETGHRRVEIISVVLQETR
jgi:hypothetical protein